MPFRDLTPNHPGTLKRAAWGGGGGFTMQTGTHSNHVHDILLCSFMCVTKKTNKLWNTATCCFHTEGPLRKNNAANVRAKWFNNLRRRFGHFLLRNHKHSLITRLRSLRALINIHRRDDSLAKYYHCWLAGDCSEGQIFPGILIRVSIFQACWTLDMMSHQGTN